VLQDVATPQQIELPIGESHEILVHVVDGEPFGAADVAVRAGRDSDRVKTQISEHLQCDALTASDIEHAHALGNPPLAVRGFDMHAGDGNMRLGRLLGINVSGQSIKKVVERRVIARLVGHS
jgi:hypothetical protein